MNAFFYLPLVAFIITFAGILTYRSKRIISYERLVERISTHNIGEMIRFVDGESWDEDDAEFWNASDKLRGTLRRIQTSTFLLQICQLGVQDKSIAPEDCLEVLRTARLQMLYSVIAIPEALICALLPVRVPHVAARVALKFCAETLARTRTLTDNEDLPICLGYLGTN